jgi:predicted DNA-binding transcriptional regulator AlpA
MSTPKFQLPDPAAIDVANIPDALAELERVRAALWARLAMPTTAAAPTTSEPDRLLTAENVHAQTQLSIRWLYRHADALPFTRRIGRKVLFSSVGLAKWLATRRP